MDAQQKIERKFDHELRDGKSVDASIGLQHEFEKDPREALAIIQREQKKESDPNNKDKSTISVAKNGDVFVYGSDHAGYYAGSIPKEFLAKQGPATQVAEQPTPLAPPPGSPGDSAAAGQAPAPGQGDSGFHIPSPIQIGVHDGSLQLGVNLFGLIKGGITLGEQNRGYVGSDVLKSEVSAGVDLSGRHIGPAVDANLLNGDLLDGHGRVGIDPMRHGAIIGARGDANALGGIIQAGGHAGAEVGPQFGPDAGGYGYLGAAGAEANGQAKLSSKGIRAGVTGQVGAEPYAGVATGAKVAIGTRNEAHVDARTHVGSEGINGGIGLYKQLRPGAYLTGYSAADYLDD